MQESLAKKIQENLYALVDATGDLQELLNICRDKGVLTVEDVEEINKIDISFDKKTKFYSTLIKKDDEAFDVLLGAFKSTGNEEGVSILTKESPVVEADVTVETTNQEGVNLAEDMEKEFERIQTQEIDSDHELQEVEGVERYDIQVTEEHLKKEDPEESPEAEEPQILAQEVEEVESSVRVEVTPAESPEPEIEELSMDEVEVTGLASTNAAEVVEEKEPEEIKEAEPEPVEEHKAKQVSFETPKEFVISKDESYRSSDEEAQPSGKSIVALNREIFEKTAPKGVKVKYSFKKDDASQSLETPENKVANLKNFFQNLGSKGSKDDASAVERREGNKMGGVHPNRRTVAS